MSRASPEDRVKSEFTGHTEGESAVLFGKQLTRVPQFGRRDEKVYRERSPKPDQLSE
jgi:hypothetical protein